MSSVQRRRELGLPELQERRDENCNAFGKVFREEETFDLFVMDEVDLVDGGTGDGLVAGAGEGRSMMAFGQLAWRVSLRRISKIYLTLLSAKDLSPYP